MENCQSWIFCLMRIAVTQMLKMLGINFLIMIIGLHPQSPPYQNPVKSLCMHSAIQSSS